MAKQIFVAWVNRGVISQGYDSVKEAEATIPVWAKELKVKESDFYILLGERAH